MATTDITCPVCNLKHIQGDKSACPQCDSDLTCFKILDKLQEVQIVLPDNQDVAKQGVTNQGTADQDIAKQGVTNQSTADQDVANQSTADQDVAKMSLKLQKKIII